MSDWTEERKRSSTGKENTLKIHLFDLAVVIN